jgi:hypothetical protein
MRLLKCYLANDREGHFVTAGEVMRAPGQVWSCTSCGCQLLLHTGSVGDYARFEHDTQTVAWDMLMNCAHLDLEVKAGARHRKSYGLEGCMSHRGNCHASVAERIFQLLKRERIKKQELQNAGRIP